MKNIGNPIPIIGEKKKVEKKLVVTQDGQDMKVAVTGFNTLEIINIANSLISAQIKIMTERPQKKNETKH